MKAQKMVAASCTEIISCLGEEHLALRKLMAGVGEESFTMERRREAFRKLLPLLDLHTKAEEEVLLARALEVDALRADAMEAFEEHDLSEFVVEKVRMAANDDQWNARVRVFLETLNHHLEEEEEDLFPKIREWFSEQEREELGMRYREARQRNELAPVFRLPDPVFLLREQSGRVGYLIAWLLGVPVWILLLIFLVRGH